MCDNQLPMCNECGKSFSSNSSLYQHLRSFHQIEPGTSGSKKDIECFLCNKTFYSKSTVRKHLDDIHQVEIVEEDIPLNPVTFKCEYCPKCYLQKKDLNKHLRLKHGAPRADTSSSSSPAFGCELCGKKFVLRDSALEHWKMIHGKNGEGERADRFQCNYCDNTYKRRKDLYHHVRIKHTVVKKTNNVCVEDDSSNLQQEKRKRVLCPVCSEPYSCKFTLERHLNRKHSDVASEYLKKPEPSGQCPLCDANVRQGDHAISHLLEAHEVNMEVEKLHFTSIDAFNTWKDEMCKETLTSYAKARGDKGIEDGQRIFLQCHRSGKYRCRGLGLRYRDPDKTIKIGKVCPSRLVVTITSEGVSVIHYKTHFGHENSLTTTRLRQSERKKLMNGIPKAENPVPGKVGEVVDQRQKLANLVASTNDLVVKLEEPDLSIAVKQTENILECFKTMLKHRAIQSNENLQNVPPVSVSGTT